VARIVAGLQATPGAPEATAPAYKMPADARDAGLLGSRHLNHLGADLARSGIHATRRQPTALQDEHVARRRREGNHLRRLRRPLQHRLTAEEIACRKAANAVSRIQIRTGRDYIRLRRRALKNRSREHDNLTACLQALGLLLLCGELLVPLQLQLLGLLKLLQLQLLVKGLL